jgi:hypothetical protein
MHAAGNVETPVMARSSTVIMNRFNS